MNYESLSEIKQAPKPLFISGKNVKSLFSGVVFSDGTEICPDCIEDGDCIRVEDRPDGGLDWTNESELMREEAMK
jgi:hypothetical protein